MKILEYSVRDGYSEIVVERNFLGFKHKTAYRKRNDVILKYTDSHTYKDIGTGEYLEVKQLFNYLK